jgi:hypothetical protein
VGAVRDPDSDRRLTAARGAINGASFALSRRA